MKTIKAVSIALLSAFTFSQSYGQVIVKDKSYSPYYYKEPKYKVKEKDGIPVIKSKDYGGYNKSKRYYYDNNHRMYYYWDGTHRVYYYKGMRP